MGGLGAPQLTMLYQERNEHCESERSHHGGDQAYGQKQGDDDGCHSKGDQEPARKARYRDLCLLSKRQHTVPPPLQRRQLGRSISAYDDKEAVTGDKKTNAEFRRWQGDSVKRISLVRRKRRSFVRCCSVFWTPA